MLTDLLLCDECSDPIDEQADPHFGHENRCPDPGSGCDCSRWWHPECCPVCAPDGDG